MNDNQKAAQTVASGCVAALVDILILVLIWKWNPFGWNDTIRWIASFFIVYIPGLNRSVVRIETKLKEGVAVDVPTLRKALLR